MFFEGPEHRSDFQLNIKEYIKRTSWSNIFLTAHITHLMDPKNDIVSFRCCPSVTEVVDGHLCVALFFKND